MEKINLYFDMDGVITRFHDEEDFLEGMYEEGFFAKLEPYYNMVQAVKEFTRNPDYEVNIISSVLGSVCEKEKHEWLDKHLPEINKEHRYFPILGTPKPYDLKMNDIEIGKNDVLVDDYCKNLQEWQDSGGTAILCFKSTALKSHLKWANAWIPNYENVEIIVNKLKLLTEPLKLEKNQNFKFYNKVYPEFFARNYDGCLEDYSKDVPSNEILNQVRKINLAASEIYSEFSNRGLMDNFENVSSELNLKVKSIFQQFEIINDDVFLTTECSLNSTLTDEEINELKEFISEQNQYGVGEDWSNYEIDLHGGALMISIWNSESDYKIMTESELKNMQQSQSESQNQDFEMKM